MATKKKIKKAKPRHLYRNAAPAAPARSVPRAVVVRPRRPLAAELAKDDEKETKRDSGGWRALKAAGGALASTVAGAYLAQQDWVPVKAMTGLLSGLGLLLAIEGPDAWKPLGLGAMSAAGGQLGFMLIDDQLIKPADADDDRGKAKERDNKESTASKPSAPASGKRQAADIPADALARAYERARLRMALTSDPSN